MKNGKGCVVIGGGVAGLWTAWALTEVGMDVTVLDGAKAGSGASWGNAGWICPAQAGPLPEPGIIAHGFRDLARRDSTLHFSPSAVLRLAPWIARFATYCNQDAYDDGVTSLSTLGYPSFRIIEQLGLDEHVDKTGLFTISRKREDVERFVAKLAPLAGFGQEVSEILTGDAVQDVDPIVPRGHTGVLISNHWQVVPHTFTAALLEKVRSAGVEVVEDRQVVGFDAKRDWVRSVRTETGTVSADYVVIAAGVATAALARKLGRSLPVVGGKGYSVDVRPGCMPRQAIDALDTHLALSPMGDRTRIVGGMEFSYSSTRAPTGRVDAMKRRAEGLLGSWSSESRPWAGLRPVAPDGMPLLGRLGRHSNVFVATGYSMLGMTISPAAGTYLANAIVSGDDGASGPFSPQRFDRRRRRRPTS